MQALKRRAGKNSLVPQRRRQAGQAAAEYVMLLVVLVTVFFAVGRTLRDNVRTIFQNRVSNKIQKALADPGALHKFRL